MNNEKIINATQYKILNHLLAAAIGFFIIIYFILIYKMNINWDEFHFLSQIYDYDAGRAISKLQTFHVHFYSWLASLGANEINQIFIARNIQLVILLASCLLIYKITRIFFSNTAALFSVFITLSQTDIIRNGFSFRYDTMCLFFFLLSIFLVLQNKRAFSVISGTAFALGVLISIKMLIYMPSLAMLFAATRKKLTKHHIQLMPWIFFAASTCITFMTLFAAHATSIEATDIPTQHPDTDLVTHITGAASKTLLSGVLFPRLAYLLRSLIENPTTWLIILISIALLTADAVRNKCRARAMILLSFALPLIYIIVYRNAFSYFYVAIIPVAAITTGAYITATEKAFRESRKVTAAFLSYTPILLILISSSTFISTKLTNQTVVETAIIKQIHKIFPSPVPYIDRNGMVSSYKKVGFFMSSWGMEKYRKTHPIMRKLLTEEQPKFILSNHPALRIDDPKSFGEKKSQYLLFDDDYKALHNNFIKHWGPVYVPGKTFHTLKARTHHDFDILIHGTYTIEAKNTVIIDSKKYRDGQTIYLSAGRHSLNTLSDVQTLTLRWGDNLYKPSFPPPTGGIYTGL